MLRSLMGRRRLFGACAAATAMAAGCGGEPPPKPPSTLRVVATTMQIGDLVREIAARRADLKVLMGPGADPHTYKPTAADAAAMAKADLVFHNGLGLEAGLSALLARPGSKSVAVSATLPELALIPAGEDRTDPHIWLDPRLWKVAAGVVAGALIRVDREGEPAYRFNLQRLAADLDGAALDAYRQIARIPEARRVLVTSHDAFAYLGRAYGLKTHGLSGPAGGAAPDEKALKQAVEFIVQNKAPAVFAETSQPAGAIDRLLAECAGGGVAVQGGKGSGLVLYSGAMGAVGEREGYAVDMYLGMYRYNVETIVRALLAPPAPPGARPGPTKGPGG